MDHSKSDRIPLADLNLHPNLQSRVAIDPVHVKELMELLWEEDENGKVRRRDLNPITVHMVDEDPLVTDGFHRVAAYRKAGRSDIPVIIIPATDEEAFIFSLGANAKHGLKRSNEDKRNAVLRAMKKFPGWKASVVAQKCGVSKVLVTRIIEEQKTQKSTKPYPTITSCDLVQSRTESDTVSKGEELGVQEERGQKFSHNVQTLGEIRKSRFDEATVQNEEKKDPVPSSSKGATKKASSDTSNGQKEEAESVSEPVSESAQEDVLPRLVDYIRAKKKLPQTTFIEEIKELRSNESLENWFGEALKAAYSSS